MCCLIFFWCDMLFVMGCMGVSSIRAWISITTRGLKASNIKRILSGCMVCVDWVKLLNVSFWCLDMLIYFLVLLMVCLGRSVSIWTWEIFLVATLTRVFFSFLANSVWMWICLVWRWIWMLLILIIVGVWDCFMFLVWVRWRWCWKRCF